MLKRQLERYGKWLVAVLALAVVATVCGTYIALQQRLRTPFQERYSVKAELVASTGLTAGLGQPVNVAGVHVGTISGTELKHGRAVVELSIDPGKLPKVYADARASFVPRTALKDMQIELYPGTASEPEIGDAVIPVARTTVPIDSDELLNALDVDTRDFFQILVADGERGVDDRGTDLREILRALGPTTRQLEQLGGALASRRREMRRLVHNLNVLGSSVASKDKELVAVVENGNATLGALASEEAALRESIARLPGTLAKTRRTLDHVTPFARDLGPALTALQPAVRDLPATLRALRPLVTEAEPVLRTKLRPLVRELLPVVDDLTPTVRDLSAVTPALVSVFQVLTYTVNELAYNPAGDNEGFLFWLAWFAHNSNSMTSTQDAHGAVWRGLALVSCATLSSQPALAPMLTAITGPIPAC